MEDSNRQWDLIASAGLDSGATDERWEKLSSLPNEIVICIPEDPNLAELGHPHSITEDPETGHLLKHLRRDTGIAGGEAAFAEGPEPSPSVNAGLHAFRLATAATAESASTSELGKRFWRRATELGLGGGDCVFPGLKCF